MPASLPSAPATTGSRWSAFTPLLVVLFAVSLNAASGIVLKSMANRSNLTYSVIVAGIMLVLFINGLRFLSWSYAHKRFPLSSTYPLTSLFYPVMLVVAYFYDEPIGLNQWLGTILITIGVGWLSLKVRI